MRYETSNFEELIQYMASCERLGLFYVVQRDEIETKKSVMGFGKSKTVPVWRLQVIQYVEESEEVGEENENLQGRHGEGEEVDGETEGGNGSH
jgi:hypothetical protein